MDINAIVSVTQVATQNGMSLALICLLSVGVLIWLRTRSIHILMARLWRLFNGKADYGVPLINDFLNSHSAVLQFRFMTGVRVRTLQQVESLCSWMTKNNEGIGDVAACGAYFDLERPGLKPREKLPRVWHLGTLLGAAILLGILFFVALRVTTYDRAFLRLNASRTWFSLDTVSAIPLGAGTGFKLDRCAAIDTIMKSNSGFPRKDIETICETAKAGQVGPYVDTVLSSQRESAGLLSVYLLCFFLWTARWFWRGGKAHEMRQRLATRAAQVSIGDERAAQNDGASGPGNA